MTTREVLAVQWALDTGSMSYAIGAELALYASSMLAHTTKTVPSSITGIEKHGNGNKRGNYRFSDKYFPVFHRLNSKTPIKTAKQPLLFLLL